MDFVTSGIALLIVAILVALVARRLSLPYSVGLVIAGIGLAVSRVHIGLALTPEFIFSVLLPPLLFEAALHIHWKELRRDMPLVLLLAIGGVLISALFTAAGMVYLLGWPWQVAAVFGVLIAATDPVSVIALFKDMNVTGRMRLIMESESLFNDGVAAVLFASVLAYGQAASAPGAVTAIILQFVLLVVGGLLIGALCAMLGILIAHRTEDHLIETALTVVIAYGSFLLAQTIGVSGVLASVMAGLVIGNVGFRGKSSAPFTEEGRHFVVEFWEFMAFLSETVMFLLIGLRIAEGSFSLTGWHVFFIAIVLVLVARALAVYPISWAFASTQWALPRAKQHILWWGGLRGGIAIALCLSLPDSLLMHDQILTATFAIVAFSVLVQGASMPWVLKQIRLPNGG